MPSVGEERVCQRVLSGGASSRVGVQEPRRQGKRFVGEPGDRQVGCDAGRLTGRRRFNTRIYFNDTSVERQVPSPSHPCRGSEGGAGGNVHRPGGRGEAARGERLRGDERPTYGDTGRDEAETSPYDDLDVVAY